MKASFPLFFVAILLVLQLLSSCSHTENETLLPELVRAETIMYQYPDSALAILEQMNMPPATHRLQHATWCLLLTQAKYKNYIDAPNDSLINIAYEYFMKQDNSQRKALVLYLEGALNDDWNEPEKATQYYLAATREIDKVEDFQLAHLVYAGLGDIYVYRFLYESATDAYQKAYNYAVLSKDKAYIARSLSYIGRIYGSLKNWKRSIKYYEEALALAMATDNTRILCAILGEFSAVCARANDYLSALAYIERAINIEAKTGIEVDQRYLTKGNLYRLMGKNDSAYYFLNKSLQTNNIYTKRSTYQALYLLSKKEKNYINTLEYGEKIQFYKDSIQAIDRSRAVLEMEKKYKQEKILNEKNQLKIEKDRVVRNSLIGIIVLLCIIACVVFFYQRQLIQKQRTIRENEELIKKYLLRIHTNESLISRNNDLINELQLEMEQNKGMQELVEEQQNAITDIQNQNKNLLKENKDLQQNISHYSASLNKKTEELDALKALSEENKFLRDREKFLCAQLVKQTHTLNNLKTNAKFLEVLQWEEVFAAINLLYNNFTERLQKDIPSLTESEIQICCLIKLRLSIPDMATVFAISSTSVSKKKLRLKERITLRLGKVFEDNQSLDSWLWDY